MVNVNWFCSDDNGSTTGVGLGYNIDVDQLRLSPAAKTIYVHHKDEKEGMFFALGSSASYSLSSLRSVYGEFVMHPHVLLTIWTAIKEYRSRNNFSTTFVFEPASGLSIRHIKHQ